MKRCLCFLGIILILISTAAGSIPAAAETAQSGSLAEQIIDYNLLRTSSETVQDWIDGYLTENADAGTEWYAIALSNYGDYDFSLYKKALEAYLGSDVVSVPSSRLKYALALIAAGERNSPCISDFLENSVGEQGIMSLIFGLHILNNGYTCAKYSQESLTTELLELQSADGGWSLTGKNGDVDVTAMTVQAIAPQYDTDSTVKKAVNQALLFLSSKQNEDGTFSSYGVSNPESVAQVIIALSSLGINAKTDTRFIRNSKNLFDALEAFALDNGGYCHKVGGGINETATVQVFCAAVAFEKMKQEGIPFYIFNKTSEVTPQTTEKETTTVLTTKQPDTTITFSSQQETLTSEIEKITSSAETVEEKKTNSDKLWIIIAVVGAVAFCCSVLLICKKIKPVHCIIIFVLTICVVSGVLISEGNSEYTENPDAVGTVTITIVCDTVKDKKGSEVPENGIVLEKTEVEINKEDTVYDVLSAICRENSIHLEVTGSKDTLYVEGISNIYEKEYGELSGWMYFVNGESPPIGCGNYKLSDADEILWCYTCDLGADLCY